jgi:hypothetical protein
VVRDRAAANSSACAVSRTCRRRPADAGVLAERPRHHAEVRLLPVKDWATIASLATAGGTLVLAVATFASIRSANRSSRTAERAARTAERSLLAGQRPLLLNSRLEDPQQKILFSEGKWLAVAGGGATLEVTESAVYMAIAVRNVGTGLAVLHGWHVQVGRGDERAHPPLEEFTSQVRDIYVAPGDSGFWQGAFRDPAAEVFQAVTAAIEAESLLMLSLLYGDFEGGQRVISQFALRRGHEKWLASAGRHFNVDRPDPR